MNTGFLVSLVLDDFCWRDRKPSARARENKRLASQIKQIHAESRCVYGAPRVHAQLRSQSVCVSRKRVARLMRETGLCGIGKHSRKRTTIRRAGVIPFPDLVERNFQPGKPNQVWAGDITYIKTREGWVYLAAVIDLYSRKVVGLSMDTVMQVNLVRDALDMAIGVRNPAPGIIHHSDQGSQYTSVLFTSYCKQKGIMISMGSKGDCYDSAACEAFFRTLKTELIHHTTWETHSQTRTAVFQVHHRLLQPTTPPHHPSTTTPQPNTKHYTTPNQKTRNETVHKTGSSTV